MEWPGNDFLFFSDYDNGDGLWGETFRGHYDNKPRGDCFMILKIECSLLVLNDVQNPKRLGKSQNFNLNQKCRHLEQKPFVKVFMRLFS